MGQEHVLVATGMGMSALVAAMFVVNWTSDVQPLALEEASMDVGGADDWRGMQRTSIPFPDAEPKTTPSPEPMATPLVEIGSTFAAPGGGGTPLDSQPEQEMPVLALGPMGRWLLGDAVSSPEENSDDSGSLEPEGPVAPKLLGVPGVRDGVDALLAGEADAALLLGPLAVP